MTQASSGDRLDLRGAQGVQIGDGGVQVNVFKARPEISRPWMAPLLSGPFVPRPEELDGLFAAVTRDGAGPATLTTAIEGAGGFGKTTLATVLAQDPRISDRFPGGLLWVTVGERSHGARLAQLAGGLCEVLSGDGVSTADPEAAGGRLGELLDARDPILLVVDDVWRPEQLAPFMIGGRSCRRLITTRNAGVAPRKGVTVMVDAMTPAQAAAMLTDGVDPEDAVPPDLLARLLAGTGRWPLLLSLVNATLIDQLDAGAGARPAAEWVLRRLEADGPVGFDTDLGDESDRSHAVEATMAASLELLTPDERERYLDLAVLPEDTQLPGDVLARLWHATGGLSDSAAEKLRTRLVRLRLVLPGWDGEHPAIRLHDTLAAYLRHRLGPAELRGRHAAVLAAAAAVLPDRDGTVVGAGGGGVGGGGGGEPWWSLPATAGYFWRHLPHHLAGAGRTDERDQLVVDLRWVAAKSASLGSSVPVEVDLAEVPTPLGRALRRALGSMTELLVPGDPPAALSGTLYAYLSAVPGLDQLTDAYRRHLGEPQLVAAWPLPDQPGPGVLRTLTGHANGVMHCAFSPDGRLLATASHDRTVRLWDVETGRVTTQLTEHEAGVSACAFSPDGTRLATAGHDRTIRIWDVATGLRQVRLMAPESVTSCAFSPDGTLLATTGHDPAVRIWEVAGGGSATPGGAGSGGGSGDGSAAGNRPRLLEGHTGPVLACAFSPDGRVLATAGADRTVRLWPVATGAPAHVLAGHTDTVADCAFSPDGRVLATASHDRTVVLWDAATRHPIRTLDGHGAAVLTCAFSPDGAVLATGGSDLTARLWDVATGAEPAVLSGRSESLTCCAFSPDGALLAIAGHDWKVQLWATGSGFTADPHAIRWEYACAFSPDGTRLASAGHDRRVRIWNTRTGDLELSLEGHTDTVSGCAFSPDGARLASSSHDGTLRVWDAATGRALGILTGDESGGRPAEVNDCAFSPDGALLASAGQDDTVRIWDAGGRLVRTLSGHTGAVSACAFSPDGTLLASAGHDHTVRLWHVATGSTHAVLVGHTDLVSDCAFSPDGTLVASSGHDRTARLWDVAGGRLRQTLTRHTSGVTACAFAPDGSLVTTDIGERRIRRWRPGADQPWCGLRVVNPLLHVAWHPNEPLLAAAGESGSYLFRYLPDGAAGGSGPGDGEPDIRPAGVTGAGD